MIILCNQGQNFHWYKEYKASPGQFIKLACYSRSNSCDIALAVSTFTMNSDITIKSLLKELCQITICQTLSLI